MTDHVNNIAETGAIKVRFNHAGVDAGDGIHRPMCRPHDLRLTMVKHEADVTCPHCLARIQDFKAWMDKEYAAGRTPE